MKLIIIITLLTFCKINIVLADGGNCVKYKVSVELKNKKGFQGYFLIGSYEPMVEFNNISFYDYLRNLHRDSFLLYTRIIRLNYPITNESPNCDYHYSAIPEKTAFKISIDEINSIDLLSYSSCDFCNDSDLYYFLDPIKELNDNEIKLLNNKPIADSSYSYNAEFNPNKIWIISYNKSYGLKEIDKIWIDYYQTVKMDVINEDWIKVSKKYSDLKKKLRSLSIVVFDIHYSM